MCMRRFLMIGAVCCLLSGLPGCTEQQVEKVDKVLDDANAVTTGVVELVRGPAGAVFPPIVRTIAELLGVTLAVALGLWQKIKHMLTKESLAAIVKGVEAMDDKTKESVKTEIAKAMDKQASASKTVTYAKLNAEVDKAKVS